MPCSSIFFAISFFVCKDASYLSIALSTSLISTVIRYLELKLHNFTSFCNILNILRKSHYKQAYNDISFKKASYQFTNKKLPYFPKRFALQSHYFSSTPRLA